MRESTTPAGLTELVAALLDELVRTNVEFVIARNFQGYPDVVTGDIDLIIPAEQHREALDRLVGRGASMGWKPFLRFHRPYLAYLGIAATESSNDRGVLVIELFDGGVWAGLQFLSPAPVLEQSLAHRRGWRIPRPGHEAALTSLHHLLWNGRVPSKYRSRLSKLIATDCSAFQQVCHRAFGRRVGSQIGRIASRGEWAELETRHSEVRFALARRSLARPLRPIREVARRLSRRRSIGRGLLVGMVHPQPACVLPLLRQLADDWHIGSPAARYVDLISLTSLERKKRVVLEKGGLLMLVGPSLEDFTSLQDFYVERAEADDRYDMPEPSELLRRVLSGSAAGAIRR